MKGVRRVDSPLQPSISQHARFRKRRCSSHSSGRAKTPDNSLLPPINAMSLGPSVEMEVSSISKRRLFPIFRSVGYASPVPNEHRRRLSSTSAIPGRKASKFARVQIRDCSWLNNVLAHDGSDTLGGESRSTSSGTVQIHPALISARSVEQPEWMAPRATEVATPEIAWSDSSHRQCEACKVAESTRSPGRSRVLQRRMEETSMRLKGGDSCHGSNTSSYSQPQSNESRSSSQSSIEYSTIRASRLPKYIRPAPSITKKLLPIMPNLPRSKWNCEPIAHDSCVPTGDDISGFWEGPGQSEIICEQDRKVITWARNQSDIEPNGFPGACIPSIRLHSISPSMGFDENLRQSSNSAFKNEKSSFLHNPRGRSGHWLSVVNPNTNCVVHHPPPRSTRSTSPDISPRMWVRRNGSSSSYFPLLSRPREADSCPTVATTDKKLEIFFGDGVPSGEYLVEIEVDIWLSDPDTHGWRKFSVHGFPLSQNKEVTGALSFRLGPLPAHANTLATTGQRSVGSNDRSFPEAQFVANNLDAVQISNATQISGSFCLCDPLTLSVRLKTAIWAMPCWDGSFELQTFPRRWEDHELQLLHHASLAMVLPKDDIFAERVSFSFLVKNVPFKDQTFGLQVGEHSIHLDTVETLEEESVEFARITVVRNVQDLAEPLEVYFETYFSNSDQVTIRLPSITPEAGKALSETVVLAKPLLPLVVKYLPRETFTTWECTNLCDGQLQILRFARVEVPRLLPYDLKDDIIVRVEELHPVRFGAAEAPGNHWSSEKSTDFAWDLDIKIDRTRGQDLECQMGLSLMVGNTDQILHVNPQGWIPDLFMVDGRLTTQAVGEWREDVNGLLTLIKMSTMGFGQTLRLEMRWKKPVISDNSQVHDGGVSKTEYELPKIIDKPVLGGSLECNVDSGMHRFMILR